MEFEELYKLLEEKNIMLEEFDLVYIVPCIAYKDNKEVVEEFDIKFKLKREDDENGY